ncbi:MAG TPA: hypothetical protein ACFYD6_05830 [Candidatus Brocadiia bacterium]|nr:hypothetical protein [Planctomycetota bacterium]MBI4007256.1 hypothetical protein [Planctomycetota bacterium]MDO8092006.1 hypothetical protein [Candidatus Brocadiales bacterium]
MNKSINAKLASIEEELKVVKAQVAKHAPASSRKKRFVDLEGIWKGKADFSFEEIEEAKIKLKKCL